MLLSLLLALVKSFDASTFGVNSSVMTKENKAFVSDIIAKYGSVKYGCVLLLINKVHPDYADYIATTVSALNSSGYIINFDQNKEATLIVSTYESLYVYKIIYYILKVGEMHVKIAVVDPVGELNHIYQIFGKIKIARAKIIVICTRQPHRMLLNIIMHAYRRLKCLNSVVVYEHLGKIYKFTVNPFLPEQDFIVKLNGTENLFYNKLSNMMGYKLNALFSYDDRTKAISKETENGYIYMGKDYAAIVAIFKHMNASLNIIRVNDILKHNETNPWVNSNRHVNRLAVKQRIINDYNISVVIHSQPFLMDDGITENTYPHTQDDDCIVVLKGSELSLLQQLFKVFSIGGWIFNCCACVCKYMTRFYIF